MSGLFSRSATFSPLGATGITTLARARNQEIRTALSTPVINNSVGQLLSAKVAQLSPEICARLQGVTDPAEQQKILKNLVAVDNALPNGSLRLLESSEYFSLMLSTPHPEAYRGGKWEQDQVLIHSPADLGDIIDLGANFLGSNTTAPGFAPVVAALPAAGMASRASAELLARPDLLGMLQLHQAMEGLEPGVFPPRFMYPVRTRLSEQETCAITLLSLMLQNSREISREAGATIGSILMLHPNMVNYVLGKIEQNLSDLTEKESDSIALFPQPLSVKYQVGSGQYTAPLFPAGHGDFPAMMAQAQLFNFLAEQGTEMMFFSNADEIVYAPNPVLVGVGKRLIEAGYSAIVFVVANTNGQEGGGPFKHLASNGSFLQETPVLPLDIKEEISQRSVAWKEMLKGVRSPSATEPLPPINTLSLVLSIPAMAKSSNRLATVTPGLDVKPYGQDNVLGLESWSGTELTKAAALDPDFRVAFVFVERTGFFTGIKMPKHVYDNFQGEKGAVPPELWNLPATSPFHQFSGMTYFQYIRHLAENYPRIIRGMFARDQQIIERLYRTGGSYLIET